jgi:hypothetical protein
MSTLLSFLLPIVFPTLQRNEILFQGRIIRAFINYFSQRGTSGQMLEIPSNDIFENTEHTVRWMKIGIDEF